MHPHEFKAFKSFFETLRTEFSFLRQTIQKSIAAISDQRIIQQQSREKEWKAIQEILRTDIDAKKHEQGTAETNQESRHRQNLKVQVALAIGTWLAFAAAAIYAWEAHKQIGTMKDSLSQLQTQTSASREANRINRAAAIVSERAYVNAVPAPFGTFSAKDAKDGTPVWVYQFAMENGGNTPAFDVRHTFNDNKDLGFKKLPQNFSFPEPQGGPPPFPGLQRNIVTPIVISPHRTVGGGALGFREDDLLQVNSAKEFIFLWGTIRYRDMFGCFHETQFCRQIAQYLPAPVPNGTTMMITETYPEHNCTDQDCPNFQPTDSDVCRQELNPFPVETK